eukprot:TRINITY_DN87_c0_g2_i1.p1 TRINITY_DN87_c0_g2~~TRINITY_DN87_c0_g2_i1.p1  ORF type:complete len:340 (-),score=-33.19 TRINITY_DN87_c0_g2_i1:161-1180(-)
MYIQYVLGSPNILSTLQLCQILQIKSVFQCFEGKTQLYWFSLQILPKAFMRSVSYSDTSLGLNYHKVFIIFLFFFSLVLSSMSKFNIFLYNLYICDISQLQYVKGLIVPIFISKIYGQLFKYKTNLAKPMHPNTSYIQYLLLLNYVVKFEKSVHQLDDQQKALSLIMLTLDNVFQLLKFSEEVILPQQQLLQHLDMYGYIDLVKQLVLLQFLSITINQCCTSTNVTGVLIFSTTLITTLYEILQSFSPFRKSHLLDYFVVYYLFQYMVFANIKEFTHVVKSYFHELEYYFFSNYFCLYFVYQYGGCVCEYTYLKFRIFEGKNKQSGLGDQSVEGRRCSP